jgi:hypothetical protein
MRAMAEPEDSLAKRLGGHAVGIAMIAIFAGMALVVAFAASDGAIFGQNLQPAASSSVPVSDGTGAAVSSDEFDAPNADTGPAEAETPASEVTLSEEERQLLSLSDFPWDSAAKGQLASNEEAFERFEQTIPQNVPAEAGTEPLSLSDAVLVEVDRRDRDRGDSDRDDSDRDLSIADVIEIDLPLIGDDEETAGEDDQEPIDEEEQEDTENDQGDGNGTDDSSGGGPDDSGGSGPDDDQSSGQDDDSDSGSNDNNTDTSGPSENSGEESGGNDTSGNSTSSG